MKYGYHTTAVFSFVLFSVLPNFITILKSYRERVNVLLPSKSDTPEFSQKYKNTSLSLLGVRIVKRDMKKGRAKKKKRANRRLLTCFSLAVPPHAYLTYLLREYLEEACCCNNYRLNGFFFLSKINNHTKS